MSDNLAVASQTGISDGDLGVELPWAPPDALTATAREALVKAVARVPPAWLLAPRDGELFDRHDEAYARLQGYALAAPTLPQLPRQPPSHNIVSSTNGLMVYRETLSPEAQARLDADAVCLQEQLLEHTRQQEASKALLPRVLPAPIQSGFNRKAKSHDKTTKRSMLGVEIAEQAANKAQKEQAANQAKKEQAANKAKKEQAANKAEKEQARDLAQAVEEERIPDTQERVPDTPERPATPVQRKRTHTLVERTPGKPATPGRPAPGLAPDPPRSPSPEASAAAPSVPPPSTAPARLTRVGRERKVTQKVKDARAAGWLPEPQARG